MKNKSTEQKLVDIMFEIVFTIKDNPTWSSSLTNEEMAEWVRNQLWGCGIEVDPVGSSHGLLQG